MQEMEYNSEVVRAEEVVAKRQAAAAQALKDECEAELAEAVPALEAAIAALNTLKVSYKCYIFINRRLGSRRSPHLCVAAYRRAVRRRIVDLGVSSSRT